MEQGTSTSLVRLFSQALKHSRYDNDNSNVVKWEGHNDLQSAFWLENRFFAALKKDDPTQLCYYQSGVGEWEMGMLCHF